MSSRPWLWTPAAGHRDREAAVSARSAHPSGRHCTCTCVISVLDGTRHCPAQYVRASCTCVAGHRAAHTTSVPRAVGTPEQSVGVRARPGFDPSTTEEETQLWRNDQRSTRMSTTWL